MIKGLQCFLLISSMVSVSLFGGKNLALTKEIDNRRECVVYALPNGSTASGEENETAPEITAGYTEGFWIEEDETAYILKTYGNAVLELKKDGIREIALSAAVLPTDIICQEGKLYVYDDILSEMQIYTIDGELINRCKIEFKKDYVRGLALEENQVVVTSYGGSKVTVDEESYSLVSLEKEEQPRMDVGEYDYAEYVGTDEDENIYAVYTALVKDCSVLSGELTLQAVSAEDEVLGSYVLPVEEYTYLPGSYVRVLPNGNVYLLVPTKTTVEIRKIALKEAPESRFAMISETASEVENDYASDARSRRRKGTACKETVKLTRKEVYKRAQAMAEYEWTLKKTHTKVSKADKGVTLPREIEAIRKANEDKSSWSVKMTGIPYCWGGFYALDMGYEKKTFSKVIKQGYVAGNINPSGYYKYLTAGLDCSGYVGAALGINKKINTTSLSDIGSKVSDVKKLEKMDILVYPGEHVIFFYERLDDATLLVSESNVRNGKVVTHPKTLNNLIVTAKYQMRSPW